MLKNILNLDERIISIKKETEALKMQKASTENELKGFVNDVKFDFKFKAV